jgi:phospholipid transport system substrate-binding protein
MMDSESKRSLHRGRRGLLGCVCLGTALCLGSVASGHGSETAAASQAARLIEETSERLFAEMDANGSRAIALVDRLVSPHVDYERIARLALGRHWSDATAEQRTRFTEEFRSLLVRSYASTLADNADAVVEYLPASLRSDGSEAMVPTRVTGSGREALRIDYRLHRPEGEWKLVDVVVAGISLVTTHRASFSEQIGKEGLDGLIRALAERNAKPGST